MIVLGIESSCDETAAAVLEDGRRVRSSVVASQDAVHAPYGGVVPELASRRHLEVIVPVVERALAEGGTRLAELDGIAVTHGPGLVGSLLVGCSMAKSLAWAQKLPLIGVNHLEGHIYAASLTDDPPTPPFLALVVSGGHTALYHAMAPLAYQLVGETRDDAAGEAFDKVAKLLGLGFPGGPIIERVARNGSPNAIPFPLAQMTDQAPDFSFSGLKTAVSLHVKRHRPLDDREIADVAASFQATVVKLLVRKTVKAALSLRVTRIVLTGGVAANTALREGLAAAAGEHAIHLHVPPHHLCTDNAAMIAAAGTARLVAGERSSLDLNAVPDLALAPSSTARGMPGNSTDRGTTGAGVAKPGSPRLQMNYEAVLAGLPDAVIAVDTDGRVVFWNAAAEELIARSSRRAVGRTIKEIFLFEDSLIRRLHETLTSGESRSESETAVETTDNRHVPVSLVTAPLFARDGSVEGAVAVLRDLSRIQQLEGEVRRGETLAAAGRMAVGLAHEIRNPLGAIRGAVQLLQRELGEGSRLTEYTTVLLTEVDRVNRIIEMLLDLARPVQVRRVPLNLHQLFERVALLQEEAARERGITVVRRYDPSLPAILGDEDRLVQVFHNLVRNAIEAMKDGGPITLSTRVSLNPLYGKMDTGGGPRIMVEAVVADEGGGIPTGLRGRIFDPFFTTKESGLGLGLALCHRILEEHHGAIQVESIEGKGTTVTCFLPIAKA